MKLSLSAERAGTCLTPVSVSIGAGPHAELDVPCPTGGARSAPRNPDHHAPDIHLVTLSACQVLRSGSMGAVDCAWTLEGHCAPTAFLSGRHFSNSTASPHPQAASQAQLRDLRPARLPHHLAALARFQVRAETKSTGHEGQGSVGPSQENAFANHNSPAFHLHKPHTCP